MGYNTLHALRSQMHGSKLDSLIHEGLLDPRFTFLTLQLDTWERRLIKVNINK